MPDRATVLRFCYGTGVLTLPASVVGALDRATGQDLKLLLLLAAEQPALQQDLDGSMPAFCAAHGLREGEVRQSLAYWRGAGILDLCEEGSPAASAPTVSASTPAPAAPKPARADGLPNYTTEELTALLESRPGAGKFLDTCQQTLGKMFNTHEINVVMGLLDYLNLNEDYVLRLMAYGAQNEKRSLHYIEKLAFSMVADGVTDLAMLDERLETVRKARELEGQIRSLFGMKDRALTKKEKGFLQAWAGGFGYGIDEIRLAYEETVNSAGTPSLAYANAILTRWNGEGLKTASEIEAAQAKDKEAREGAAGSSFESNAFFEAALQRSYNNE